jgi:hypothetical protein
MTVVRPAILVLSLFALAALFCSHLHAGEKATKSHTCGSYDKTLPPLLDSGGKRGCTARPIWCPDGYYPKCPPRICPLTYCGGCDCYDAKCPPRICPPSYCGIRTCYDAKCPPCMKIPCFFPDFYKCPQPDCHATPASKSGTTRTAAQAKQQRKNNLPLLNASL